MIRVIAFLSGVVMLTDASTAQPIEWLRFQDALSAASVSGRTILVDVYAPWCPWCQKLQSEVYTDPEIRAYLSEHFEIARLNIDEEEDIIEFKGFTLTPAELAAGLGAEATPTTVFLDADGEYITRLPGFVDADEFKNVLKYIGSGVFRQKSYEAFRAGQP